MEESRNTLICHYRWWMTFFIVGLILSGVTAFPLVWELDLLCSWLGIPDGAQVSELSGLRYWLAYVREGLVYNSVHYPFIAYGTDWLAFAHLTIAVFFIGPWLEPHAHRATLWSGVVACVGILPLAHIAGPLREIPFYWRLIDCSFGIVGVVPLLFCLRIQKQLAADQSAAAAAS